MTQNIPFVVEMQICTFFNPDLMWREQFVPLMGQEEVDKLDKKLKSLNVAGKYLVKMMKIHLTNADQVWTIYKCNILTCLTSQTCRTTSNYRKL